jgi:hypothetical protein
MKKETDCLCTYFNTPHGHAGDSPLNADFFCEIHGQQHRDYEGVIGVDARVKEEGNKTVSIFKIRKEAYERGRAEMKQECIDALPGEEVYEDYEWSSHAEGHNDCLIKVIEALQALK